MARQNGKVTSEYQAWRGMIVRCYVKTSKRYDRYGGRGIKVCKRWRNSFEAFYDDLGPRPSPGHTIGRIDNDGNYEPSNVEWQTWSEQNCNKSNAKMLTFNGETLNAKTWAHKLGIKYNMLMVRLRRGWSVARALTEPRRER